MIKSNNLKTFGVIGGGLIGLAVAYKLALKFPSDKIVLLEKEDVIGKHQSGRNSGVLHCGLAYAPGSLKAKLSREGIHQMTEFCRTNNIDHEICGKLIVGNGFTDVKKIEDLARNGEKNGLKGLRILNKSETRKREPYVLSEKSLLVPEEGIVNYKKVMIKLSSFIEDNGGLVETNFRVKNLYIKSDNEVIVESESKEYIFNKIIVCAGLYSDKLYQRFTGNLLPLKIIPFRGDYFEIKKEYENIINHLVYPLPDKKYPFLGVHFTRMIDGSRTIGPNAALAFKREGYNFTDFNTKEFLESISYSGLRNFLIQNLNFSISELNSSINKAAFIKKAQALIPDIKTNMITKANSGVRAQAMTSDGKLMMDFYIKSYGPQIHVINAPSPGATACLSIADHIITEYF